MKLSDGEKLILIMLTEIYEKLQIKREVDPKLVQSAITGGNLWGLELAYPGIFHNTEPTPDVISETGDVLDMWRYIESSYQQLSPDDQAQVKEEARPFGNAQFRGFDANDEATYIGVARFVIDALDRFRRFKGRGLNSHMPSLGAHRRMLGVFTPLRNSLSGSDLTAAQLVEILKEQIHPENRTIAARA